MPKRRSLLKAFLSGSIAASLLSIFYPIVRFLIPPDKPEASALSVSAGLSEDLAPNSGRIFRFGSQPGLVLRRPDGSLRAYSAMCTHLDCTVQYRADLQHIYCACHEGHYDLNGVPISGPPPRPLEEYSVKEVGGEIIVSKVS
ncbi:MAG TPA: Rieske (2Fe-2S) protein [Acidobacteriota bacterium]|nr:Rieske (2Fe-2S) protein [Acidobacteriota bacterium]